MECEHAETEIRRKRDAAGRSMFRKQCLACGEGVGVFIAQKCVPEIWNVKDWDAVLAEQGEAARREFWKQESERRREQFDNELAQKDSEWWAWYNDYLNSPEWASRRKKVLSRDGATCKACGIAPATEVHHLTYKRAGEEPLFDLVAVCKPCHRMLHKDKEI